MNIKIICIGKIKEKYLSNAITEYLKRLTKYCKTTIIELPDKSISKNCNENEALKIKELEGTEILKNINDKDFIISLDLSGKQISSEELAKRISETFDVGFNTICFLIGGSLGLDKKILNKSNLILSFSKLTFPHQLFRVILLEQIYRCFKINNKETYHK